MAHIKRREDMQGFFGKLFDFSFKEFITPGIIKVIFWIAIIISGLGALAYIVGGFSEGFGMGIIALILAPLLGLLWVIIARVYLEIIMVFFRIMGFMEAMAKEKGIDTAALAAKPAFTPPPAPEPAPEPTPEADPEK
jgi:hypothetical protein